MPEDKRLAVDDGKYEFTIPANDYKIHVKRYGEPWLVLEQGSKALFHLISEMIDSRELIEALKAWFSVALFQNNELADDYTLVEACKKFFSLRGLALPDSPVRKYPLPPASPNGEGAGGRAEGAGDDEQPRPRADR